MNAISTCSPESLDMEILLLSLMRCDERDAHLCKTELELEGDGDSDGCWYAMAARAENKRFREKLVSQIEDLKQNNAK